MTKKRFSGKIRILGQLSFSESSPVFRRTKQSILNKKRLLHWFLCGLVLVSIPGVAEEVPPDQQSANDQPGAAAEKLPARITISSDWNQSDNQIPFDVKVQGMETGVTWGLYYSKYQNSIEGNQPIILGQVEMNTRITWDASSVEQGFYHVFAMAKDRNGERIFYSDLTIKIDRSTRPGNSSPFVKMLSFANNDDLLLLLAGSPVTIDFQAQDRQNDPLTYSLQYRCTQHPDWVTAVENLSPEENNNDLQFTWTPSILVVVCDRNNRFLFWLWSIASSLNSPCSTNAVSHLTLVCDTG